MITNLLYYRRNIGIDEYIDNYACNSSEINHVAYYKCCSCGKDAIKVRVKNMESKYFEHINIPIEIHKKCAICEDKIQFDKNTNEWIQSNKDFFG